MAKKLTHEEFINKIKERNKHNITILDEYQGTNNKIKTMCNNCGNVWDAWPSDLLNNHGCMKCGRKRAGRKLALSHDEFLSRVREVNKNVTIIGRYTDFYTDITVKYNCGHIADVNPRALLRGDGCPYCAGHRVLVGFNDVWTTAPDVAKLLVDPLDGYKYTRGSHQKTYFKCPECGDISYKSFLQMSRYKFVCNKCSDSISYPNKFGRAFLSQLPINNVDYEYSPYWASPYLYDNYFEYKGRSYIVEMDGGQHSEECGYCKLTLDERIARDNIKDRLAEENDVCLIRIDCLNSNCDYIKNSIMSSVLNQLFDLSNINWKLCDEFAQKNIVKEISIAYNNGNHDVANLRKMFCLSASSVRRYLQSGTKFGWCNYTIANSQKIRATKRTHPIVIIGEDGGILHYFNSVNKQLKKINEITNRELVGSQISIACKTYQPYKNINFRYADEYLPKELIDEIKLQDNAEELFFKYLEEYNTK